MYTRKLINFAGSIQIAGDLSINGNFTANNFMTSEILATKQMNSSEKLTTDSLKYANGYIDDIYVDYIQGINVRSFYK